MKTNSLCIGIESLATHKVKKPKELKNIKESEIYRQNALQLFSALESLVSIKKELSNGKKPSLNTVKRYNQVVNSLGIAQDRISLESLDSISNEGFVDSVKGAISKVVQGVKNFTFKFSKRYKEIQEEIKDFNEEHKEKLTSLLKNKDVLSKDSVEKITNKNLIKSLGINQVTKSSQQNIDDCINFFLKFKKYCDGVINYTEKLVRQKDFNENKVRAEVVSNVNNILSVFQKEKHSLAINNNSDSKVYYYPNTISNKVLGVTIPKDLNDKYFKIDNLEKITIKDFGNSDAITVPDEIDAATIDDFNNIYNCFKQLNVFDNDVMKIYGSLAAIGENVSELIERLEEEDDDDDTFVAIVVESLLTNYLYLLSDTVLDVDEILKNTIGANIDWLQESIKLKS